MKYYTIQAAEGFDWIWSKDLELRSYALGFKGKPMSKNWKVTTVDFVDEGNRDFDICVATSPLYIFTKRAVKILEKQLLKHGELLALDSPNDKYIAYHCTNVIKNIFDSEKSEINWLDKEEGWINEVEKFTLRREYLSNSSIFRIESKYSNHTFFNDDFRKIVKENNLKAFEFFQPKMEFI